ncbi:MAG: hypothetical protein OHK0038_22260 [Flammeovirgaceae bacterium]
MAIWLIFLLILGTVITSTLSALFGLAGGTLLFAMLSWALDAKQAIPLHSGIQLVSNSARLIAYIKSVEWKIVGWFSVLLLPGAYWGGMFYGFFNPNITELLVGCFILITVIFPSENKKDTKTWIFIILGFLSSFLGMIVAVTGPFISSFFVLNNITKERMLATKSVCQASTQLVKMLAFSTTVAFDFSQHYMLMVMLGLATIVGTFLGSRLIKKIQDYHYNLLNNWLLSIIAVSMIIKQIIVLFIE